MSFFARYPSDAGTLPAGSATAANQVLEIAELTDINTNTASIDTKTPTVGQKTMAASSPVVLASDQSSIPVAATLAAGSAIIGDVRIDQTTPGTTNGVQINAALPAGANIIGALAANQSTNVAQINGVTPLMGSGNTGSGSLRVTLATDQPSNTNPLLVAETTSSSSSVTSVSASASSVSLLASNSSRKNATFFNDSAVILYLKLGATASTTSYTVQIPAMSYYELPIGKIYTGAIDGIWASATGSVRITELT